MSRVVTPEELYDTKKSYIYSKSTKQAIDELANFLNPEQNYEYMGMKKACDLYLYMIRLEMNDHKSDVSNIQVY